MRVLHPCMLRLASNTHSFPFSIQTFFQELIGNWSWGKWNCWNCFKRKIKGSFHHHHYHFHHRFLVVVLIFQRRKKREKHLKQENLGDYILSFDSIFPITAENKICTQITVTNSSLIILITYHYHPSSLEQKAETKCLKKVFLHDSKCPVIRKFLFFR